MDIPPPFPEVPPLPEVPSLASTKPHITYHFWDLYRSSNTQAEYISRLLEHYPTWNMMQMLNRSGDLIKSSVRSVQSLVHQALKVTELLQKNGAKKGDRIVLVFFPSVEFSVGLYACFLGGFVAIPVPPPIRLTNDLLSFSNAVEKSGAKLALSHGIYQKFSSVQTISHKVSTFLSPSIWLGGGDKDKKKKKKKDEKISWPSKLTWVYLDGCCKSSTKDIKYPELVKKAKDMASRVNPEDLAYLQLTSGSTAFPKLVQITHRASILNVVAILPQNQGLVGRYRLKEDNYSYETCPWTPSPASVCSSCNSTSSNLRLCLNCQQTLCPECSKKSRCAVHDDHLAPLPVPLSPGLPSSGDGPVKQPVLFHHRFKGEKVVNPEYHRTTILWIPHYHDFFMFYMFASFLQNMTVTIISPLDFLMNPMVLLQACYRHKASASCCPNFAFDYMVSKTSVAQRKKFCDEIDPEKWITYFTQGGEPLHKASLDRFLEAFPFITLGHIQNALGMAEAVAGVCVAPISLPTSLVYVEKSLKFGKVKILDENNPSARAVYTCGYSLTEIDKRVRNDEEPNTRVIVVDVESQQELPEGCVGEIWVSSPSFGTGYFGWSDKDNDAVFRAVPASRITSEKGRTYLRTGDRGFILEGMVFLIGRLKATLILQGKNYEPSDIEYLVWGCHSALRPGCTVALSVPNDKIGTDELIFIAEVRDPSLKPAVLDDIAEAMRRSLGEGFGLVCPKIMFFGPKNGVLKTTSGKPKRDAIYEHYVTGCYTPLYVSSQSYEAQLMDEEGEEGEEEEIEEVEIPEDEVGKILRLVEQLRRTDIEEVNEEDRMSRARADSAPPPPSPLDEVVANISASSNDLVRLQTMINDQFGVYIPSGTLLRMNPNTLTVRQLFMRHVFPFIDPLNPHAPSSDSPFCSPSSPRSPSPKSRNTTPTRKSRASRPISTLGSPHTPSRKKQMNRSFSSPRGSGSPSGGNSYMVSTKSSINSQREKKEGKKREKDEKKEGKEEKKAAKKREKEKKRSGSPKR